MCVRVLRSADGFQMARLRQSLLKNEFLYGGMIEPPVFLLILPLHSSNELVPRSYAPDNVWEYCSTVWAVENDELKGAVHPFGAGPVFPMALMYSSDRGSEEVVLTNDTSGNIPAGWDYDDRQAVIVSTCAHYAESSNSKSDCWRPEALLP